MISLLHSNFTRVKYLRTGVPLRKFLCRFNSTIFALSSGLGKSGVAVFRISGKNTRHIFENMIRSKSLPKPRMAYLKTIYDPETGEQLDKGLVLWFPEPKSFTGEDVCELQVHGSKAVIEAVSSALSKIADFRPAEPGEFTKRSFHAGKLSLTEVEGLADLINAETEMQRKQALNQMEGSLEKIYAKWRMIISQNLALTEAYIDFSEDQDIEDNIVGSVITNLSNLRSQLQDHLNDGRKGEILRDGVRTVIIGSPNVGKSSLLNLLCRRPAAIVTEIAGTTRDVIQSTLNLNGYPVLLADTAGIRHSSLDDVIEKEGIRRSFNELFNADLIVLLADASDICSLNLCEDPASAMSSYLEEYIQYLGIGDVLRRTKHLVLFNKCDLLNEDQLMLFQQCTKKQPDIIGISCKSDFGIPFLLECLTKKIKLICGQADRINPSCSRQRHRYHLNECEKLIAQYIEIMKSDDSEQYVVFAAQKLRKAVWHLGMISGIVVTDEILSIIFKQFCIGK